MFALLFPDTWRKSDTPGKGTQTNIKEGRNRKNKQHQTRDTYEVYLCDELNEMSAKKRKGRQRNMEKRRM